MRRLVIIGNGFDRAHKLPTTYWHFMNQLSDEHADFYNRICQYLPEEVLWCEFESALADLDDEQLQDDNSCYLLGYGDENWRDSAHHDFQYMIGEALSFASEIPQYFRDWICGIDTCTNPVMPPHIVDKNNLFLSFNYTDTLEKVYDIPLDNILYIHGKASRGDELIVGHHSYELTQEEPEPIFESEEEQQLYYENYDEDVRVTEAKGVIKSYFRTTYKDTETIIKNNRMFFESLTDVDEICIYGHSLSDIDLAYFYEIHSRVSPDCIWYISYFDRKDYRKAIDFIKVLGIKSYQLFNVF